MASEDEDWEKAEVQLKSLQIEPEVKRPIVFMTRPAAPSIPDREEPIDDALVSAIENPRERMATLQLEDMMLTYVNSNSEKHLELPPGLNSFRRLVAYRLAQRFGLTTVTAELPAENGERVVRLFKAPTTCIPRPLLIDYRTEDESSNTSANTVANGMKISAPTAGLGATDDSSPSSGVSPTTEPPKKVMLMRRRNGAENASGSGKGATSKPQITAEDRERAYQEARARIFGAGATEEPAAAMSTVSTSASSNDATKLTKSVSGGALDQSTPTATTISPANPVGAPTSVKRSLSSSQVPDLSVSSGTSSVPISSAGLKGKAQVRDTVSERYDPDFVRSAGRGSGGYNSPYGSSSSSGRRPGHGGSSIPVAPALPADLSQIHGGNLISNELSFAGLNPHASSWGSSSPNGLPPPPPLLTPPMSSQHQLQQQQQQQYYYGLPQQQQQQPYGMTGYGGAYYTYPTQSAPQQHASYGGSRQSSLPAQQQGFNRSDFPPL